MVHILEGLSSLDGRNVNYFQPYMSSKNYKNYFTVLLLWPHELHFMYVQVSAQLKIRETSAMTLCLEYTVLEILAALTLPPSPHTCIYIHTCLYLSLHFSKTFRLFMFLPSVFRSGNHCCRVGWRDCRAHLICFPWFRDQVLCCLLSNIWKQCLMVYVYPCYS